MTARWGLIQDQHDRVGDWVFARTGGEWRPGIGTALGLTFDGQLAGGMAYTLYNGVNVFMAFALTDRRVMNRASLWAAFHYPFVQLACRRVTALVDSGNRRSLNFVERLGFVREGCLEHGAMFGDQFVYRMFAHDCRWLGATRYHAKRQVA